MSQFDTDRLAELVSTKYELLIQIRDLGRLQNDFIGEDDFSQLLKVLSAKQRLLNALHATEQELNPFRDQDPELRNWRKVSDRQRCAELARRANLVFHEIVEQEKQSESRLLLRRNDAATRLNGAHSAAQARGAYMTNAAPANAYLDLTSER
jgi:hypothetical protein